jgi:ankyrin repeat protein
MIDADRRLIALLLDHGADPDGTGPEGLTPLMLAAMLDCVELVHLLLERGASLDLALADGSTALSMALGVDAQRAAHLLLAMSSVNSARRAE